MVGARKKGAQMKGRIVVVASISVVAILLPIAALASSNPNARGSGSMSASPNRQEGFWRSRPVSTSATTYRALTGLQANICSIGEGAATVSVNGVGAPLALQAHLDLAPLLQPGSVTFSPTARGSIASFTFLVSTSPFEANDHHFFQVEWRSMTGQPTSIKSATLNLLYREGTHRC